MRDVTLFDRNKESIMNHPRRIRVIPIFLIFMLIGLIFVLIGMPPSESSQSSQPSISQATNNPTNNPKTGHDLYTTAITAIIAAIITGIATIIVALLGLYRPFIDKIFIKAKDFNEVLEKRVVDTNFHPTLDQSLCWFLIKNKDESRFLDELIQMVRLKILTIEQLRPFIKDIFGNAEEYLKPDK